jgi:hydrogenase maturation protease
VSRQSVLVAGIGNIFLADDGFGCEVIRQLAGREVPDTVKIEDFGIRGMHLAYELLAGYDTAILVDATPRGEPPGTIVVLDVDPADAGSTGPAGVDAAGADAAGVDAAGADPAGPGAGTSPAGPGGAPAAPGSMVDAHGMTPDQIFALMRMLGGSPGRVLVVGCEPAEITDRIGLSEPVAAAVPAAADTVWDLLCQHASLVAPSGAPAQPRKV